MNRAAAIGTLALMALATTAALLAPWPVAGAIALGALLALRSGRRGFLGFAAVTLAINALVVALAQRAWTTDGLAGGLRLCAAVGANFAILSWAPLPLVLDGLRLPPRPTAFLAAVLLAAEDVGRDLRRIRDVRRLEGGTAGRWALARDAGRFLGPLMVRAHLRSAARHDALRLAGVALPRWSVALVAVAALCAAGRMAFVAFPNIALTYVVAFLAGMLFGAWVGAAGAFVGMALTDLLLTGLYPAGFVNAPAMAALALLGAATRRVDFSGAPGRMLGATLGILGTLGFSVATDASTWLLLYADRPEIFGTMILAGLAFNVVPALVNGALFAWGVSRARAAFDAWRAPAPARAPAPGKGPGSAGEPPTPPEGPGSPA